MFTVSLLTKNVSSSIAARGRSYISAVRKITTEPGVISAKVQGSRLYNTTIFKTKKGEYVDSCSCPYGATCKHTIALAYRIQADPELLSQLESVDSIILDEVLTDSSATDFETILRQIEDDVRKQNSISSQDNRKKIIPPRNPLAWFDALEKAAPAQTSVTQLTDGLYYLLAAETKEVGYTDPVQETRLSIKVGRFKYHQRRKSLVYQAPLNLESLLSRAPTYLLPEDRTIVTLATTSRSHFYPWSDYYGNTAYIDPVLVPTILSLLAKRTVVVDASHAPIRFYSEPVSINIALQEKDGTLTFLPTLMNNELSNAPDQNTLGNIQTLIDSTPPTVWTDANVLCQLATAETAVTLRAFLHTPTFELSKIKLTELQQKVFRLHARLPMQLPHSWVEDAENINPTFVFTINRETYPWTVTLAAKYDKEIVVPTTQTPTLSAMRETGKLYKRSSEKEAVALEKFASLFTADIPVQFPFPLTDDQQERLFAEILWAIPQDWDIRLDAGTLLARTETTTISARTKSDIDWLELDATVTVGIQEIELATVLASLFDSSPLVTINGTTHLLSPAHLKRLQMLGRLADPESFQIKINRTQLGLVDELGDLIDYSKLHAQWHQSLTTLRTFESQPAMSLPKTLTAKLRPYQDQGVAWLAFLRQFGFGGILADDMGLGKTMQALTILAHAYERGEKKPSLIVAPTSVVHNWQQEIHTYAPALRTHIFTGHDRKLPKPGKTDILLTSYALLWRDKTELAKLAYHYVILDESQYIKNHAAKTTQAARSLVADHRLALTGTPLENNLSELWSQCSFVIPGLFGSLEQFKERFVTPIARQDQSASTHLKQLLRPFLLRRTKEHVAKDLPKKIEQTIICEMGERQAKLYATVKQMYQLQVKNLIATQGMEKSHLQILTALLRLRQICDDPRLLKLDDRTAFVTLPISLRKINESVKLEQTLELLSTAVKEGHKVLLFSQFTQMLALIEAACVKVHIASVKLTGQTKNRAEVIDAFQKDKDVGVFLLSLKAGGTGLNLTAADYVIHYDPWWNPAVEAQATDRAHRIGQTKMVHTYKLIVKNTIEEKIQELQKRKQGLIDDIIGGTSNLSKLTKEDIAYLFE